MPRLQINTAFDRTLLVTTEQPLAAGRRRKRPRRPRERPEPDERDAEYVTAHVAGGMIESPEEGKQK